MFSFLSKIKKGIGEKKNLKGILVFSFVLFLLLVPNVSHAWDLFDIGFSIISKIAFGISSLIALVGGMFVAVLIIALQMILQVSTGIVNSTPVQIGFPIVLSIANLGFVLAIIVIAVATILRQEGYGIKKLLANVIIMAVMVNFGLVISGAIIGFSNRITNYFLDSMTGGVTDFASIMAGTMNPQKSFEWAKPISIGDTGAGTSTVVENKADTEAQAALGDAAKNGGSFGALLLPTFSVFLTIVNIVIMIVTLAVILVSFILRYIKITFYLILLPAAWMASIFPGLKSWNGKWWNAFISQVFYPPVVIFFLWLAMRVNAGMSASDGLKFEAIKTGGGFYDFLGNMLGVPLQAILQMVVIAGIMLGGDYAGKAIGVAGAGAATKTAMSMKGWASGRVKRAGTRIGTRAIDTASKKDLKVPFVKGKTVANPLVKMSSGISNLQKSDSKIARGFGAVAGAMVNPISRYSTRAQEQMSAGASKSYKDDVAKMGDEELKVRAKVATGLELAAILERASKNPKLMTGVLNSIPTSNKEAMAGDEDLYKRYGYGKTHEEAMLSSGATYKNKKAEVEAAKKADEASSTEETKKALEKAEGNLTEALKKLTPEAANNLLFGKDGKIEDEARAKDIMRSLAGPNGWPAGKFTQLVQQSSENGNLDAVKGLFGGLEAKDISSTLIKALENGALKNLGIDGASVMGEELFAQAKAHHKIGEDGKKDKKIQEEIARNPNQSIADAKREGSEARNKYAGRFDSPTNN